MTRHLLRAERNEVLRDGLGVELANHPVQHRGQLRVTQRRLRAPGNSNQVFAPARHREKASDESAQARDSTDLVRPRGVASTAAGKVAALTLQHVVVAGRIGGHVACREPCERHEQHDQHGRSIRWSGAMFSLLRSRPR